MVAVFYGDTMIAGETRLLKAGENSLQYQFTPGERRPEFLTVTVRTPENTASGEDMIRTLVDVCEPPRILLLENAPDSAYDLAATLRRQGIELDIRSDDDVPQTLDEWNGFDAVLLSGIPATSFSSAQLEMLRIYVELGGGLLMLGGEHSFGPGGYALSPLEEILPVSCRVEKEKETPSLALALVIDRSGSMGGEKLPWAKEAAKSTVNLLTPKDFLTVIAFDNSTHVIVPIQNVTDTKNIETEIATIEAAGGTNLYPALASAYEQLNQVQAKFKHLIVLTDGYGAPGDFEGIARRMTNALMTMSTVGIGGADERLLKKIAEAGGGRYYPCDYPAKIPQIFLKETILASKNTIREEPFVPVQRTPSEILAGIPPDAFPPLLGFVATQQKPTSRLLLCTETGEPLLAWGRVGLGISAAWTSDAKNRWAPQWISWENFGTFWTQLVRSITRRPLECGTELKITQQADRIYVRLDAVDDFDRFVNHGSGVLNVVKPDGTGDESILRQTAPGRYEAAFPAEQPGVYLMHVSLQSGEKQIASQNRSFEIRNTGKSGGTENVPESGPDRRIPLYPYLLSLTVVLFVLDLFLRRKI